jgi:hypothetical protein
LAEDVRIDGVWQKMVIPNPSIIHNGMWPAGVDVSHNTGGGSLMKAFEVRADDCVGETLTGSNPPVKLEKPITRLYQHNVDFSVMTNTVNKLYLGPFEAITYRFDVPNQEGLMGSVMTNEIVGSYPKTFTTISTKRCDFNLEKVRAGNDGCFWPNSHAFSQISFIVTNDPAPYKARGMNVCFLKPGSRVYYNLRWQNASILVPNNPNILRTDAEKQMAAVDTCDTLGGFAANCGQLFQFNIDQYPH